jgi:hypothetical protein
MRDSRGPDDGHDAAPDHHPRASHRPRPARPPEKKLLVVSGSLHGTFLVGGSPSVRTLLTRFLRNPARTVP